MAATHLTHSRSFCSSRLHSRRLPASPASLAQLVTLLPPCMLTATDRSALHFISMHVDHLPCSLVILSSLHHVNILLFTVSLHRRLLHLTTTQLVASSSTRSLSCCLFSSIFMHVRRHLSHSSLSHSSRSATLFCFVLGSQHSHVASVFLAITLLAQLATTELLFCNSQLTLNPHQLVVLWFLHPRRRYSVVLGHQLSRHVSSPCRRLSPRLSLSTFQLLSFIVDCSFSIFISVHRGCLSAAITVTVSPSSAVFLVPLSNSLSFPCTATSFGIQSSSFLTSSTQAC